MGYRHWVALLWALFFLSRRQVSSSNRAENQAGKPLHYEIEEEIPPNTLIGNIALDAHLDSKYNMTILGKLRFGFLTNPQLVEEGIFAIDERSGIIQTTSRVDRDTICPDTDDCVVTFDVAIRPAKYFEIVKVEMEIRDLNDNNPRFPQTHIVHQISESTLPGKSFAIPAAFDPDSSQFSVQRYELVDSSDKFVLRVRETADRAVDLGLVLEGELDREEKDYYKVEIVAYDGEKYPNKGSVIVDIYVLDANDNAPIFTNSSYEVEVLEDIVTGTPILKLTATDADMGLNGNVEYSLARHSESEYGDTFGVDTETGDVFIRNPLDYETNKMYLLSFTAQDMGPDSLPAEASAVVKVIDVNDNPPEINVNTLTTSGDADVTENAPPGAFVAHVLVSDKDSGENGKVSCTLDNEHFQLRRMNPSEYKIITASTFDRERHPYFDLRIHCYDGGFVPLNSLANIRVSIVDENDYAPEFTQQFYSARIHENNHVDDFVIAITATDKDKGRNGWVRFKIDGAAKDLLKIDENTGWIAANTVFDHEVIQEVRFHVIATDKGADPKSSTATVQLSIIDIDDEKPEFSEQRYAFGTFENQPVGSSVGTVVAVDKDSEPFNYFKYELESHSSPLDVFEIDQYEGIIRTRRVLDREQTAVYYMTVIARGEGKSKSSTASVSVYVADRNDNRPVFLFPTPTNHTIHISNEAPTGRVIVQLRARDLDMGKYAKLAYSIIEGNEQDYFSLDASSGSISINRDLTTVETKSFKLQVRVEDDGTPPVSSTAVLEIILNTSLGYRRSRDSGMAISRSNLIMLIIFTSATVVISSIIIAVIIIIKRKDRQTIVEDSRNELEKMLPVDERAAHRITATTTATTATAATIKSAAPSNHISQSHPTSNQVPPLSSNHVTQTRDTHRTRDSSHRPRDGSRDSSRDVNKHNSVPKQQDRKLKPDSDASGRIGSNSSSTLPRSSQHKQEVPSSGHHPKSGIQTMERRAKPNYYYDR